MYRPGAYTEVRLPCVPDTDSDGVTTVKYTVGKGRLIVIMFYYMFYQHSVTCDEKDHLTGRKIRAYFEFSVLVFRY